MPQATRTFSVTIKDKVCERNPWVYTQGKSYEVLAINDEDDYTWFLIADDESNFDWITSDDCKFGQKENQINSIDIANKTEIENIKKVLAGDIQIIKNHALELRNAEPHNDEVKQFYRWLEAFLEATKRDYT